MELRTFFMKPWRFNEHTHIYVYSFGVFGPVKQAALRLDFEIQQQLIMRIIKHLDNAVAHCMYTSEV